MPSILTKEQATACACAMRTLNAIGARMDANLGGKIHVYEVANGLVFAASLVDSQIERFNSQQHFFDAYGVALAEAVVKPDAPA